MERQSGVPWPRLSSVLTQFISPVLAIPLQKDTLHHPPPAPPLPTDKLDLWARISYRLSGHQTG